VAATCGRHKWGGLATIIYMTTIYCAGIQSGDGNMADAVVLRFVYNPHTNLMTSASTAVSELCCAPPWCAPPGLSGRSRSLQQSGGYSKVGYSVHSQFCLLLHIWP